MASSLAQLIGTYALDGSGGYAYVINADTGKVTWSTLAHMPAVQKELKTYEIEDKLYIQSNTKNYFLAKSFWVKGPNNTKENFQIVLAVNY
ncbi:hypothetical protein [Thiofilum flexile]|uniref:hypothetical protein n=1 Tax=Thiofilum flexile TaxID=125627 RepID=UPI000379BF55|nr:hypothetical protein [Thiofilum flexile]